MLAAVVAVSLLVPADPPKELPEAAQKELKKLDGKWKVVKEITSNGEQEPGIGGGGEVIVEFKGRKVVIAAKEKFEFEVSSLDPAADPKCIDLKNLTKKGPIPEGVVIEGIYRLDGDNLTLVGYAGEGKKRPANFDAPKDEGTGVWILKRVKE